MFASVIVFTSPFGLNGRLGLANANPVVVNFVYLIAVALGAGTATKTMPFFSSVSASFGFSF